MTVFKEVLEIERKYHHVISSTNESAENKVNKFSEEIKLKESAYKSDFKNNLKDEFQKKVKDLTQKGEKQVKDAEIEAESILKNSHVDRAINFLVEEFKNGF